MAKPVHDLYVRTQHDEREYISVMEIFYYDDDGDEVVHPAAAGCCEALVTCGDMPERFDVLKHMVEANLKNAGIKYGRLIMADDPSG
jgi:hypothetical protein